MAASIKQKHVPVVFDVLGTLFSFTPLVDRLEAMFPTITRPTALAIVDDLFHSAQRDFTVCSSSQLK
jgi:hypothetical protein